MIPPLNPRLKRALIMQSHALKPTVIIGQRGFSSTVQAEIDRALTDHELIKVKISLEEKEQRTEAAKAIATALGAEHLKTTGHIAVFYRVSEKFKEKKKNLKQQQKKRAPKKQKLKNKAFHTLSKKAKGRKK